MKASFKKIKSTFQAMWADEAAQGATEYILLLVVVVGLAFIFKKPMLDMVKTKMDTISSDVGGFTKDQ